MQKILTIAQAAELLQVCENTIGIYIKKGVLDKEKKEIVKLKAVKFERTYRILEKDLEDFIEKLR